MKKLLLLFCSVFCLMLSAYSQKTVVLPQGTYVIGTDVDDWSDWADTQEHSLVISDVSELSNYKVYSIIPEDWYHPCMDTQFKPNGLFGVLFARADEAEEAATGGKADRLLAGGGFGNTIDNQDPRKEPYGGWQTQERAIQKDSYDPRQQFAVIQFEGKYYLWAVAAKKFVSVHDLSYLGTSTFYADLTNEKMSPLRLEKSTETEFTGPYSYIVTDHAGGLIGDENENFKQNITGPRFRMHFLNDKDNKEYRLRLTYAWHNNATYQTEALLGESFDGDGNPTYSTDGLDIFEFCERGSFDPTEAIEILDDYFHPKSTIVYQVKDEGGNIISTSEAFPIRTGTVVDDMPDLMKEEFYQYSCDPLTIQLGENILVLTKGERVYPIEYLDYAAPTELKRADWSYFSDTNPGLEFDISSGKPYYLTLNGKFIFVEANGQMDAGKPMYSLKYSDAIEEGNPVYQWVFMADNNSDGCFRIFNVELGGLYRLNYDATIKINRRNNDAASPIGITPCGKPYGTGFALSQALSSSYERIDDYLQRSEETEGAFQMTGGEGEEGERKYPVDPKHTFRAYAADEPLPDVDVTFRVSMGATTYAEAVVPVPMGTSIEDIWGWDDDALCRDFAEYELPEEPLIVMPGEVNIYVATVTFRMPFVEGKKYPILVDGKYIKADAVNNVVVIDEDADETSIADDDNYFWSFRGNPYGGIEIRNVGTDLYIANDPDITDNIALPLGTTAEWWLVYDTGYEPSTIALHGHDSDTYVVNNGGVLELSLEEDLLWEWESAFKIVQPLPSLESITIGGIPVALEDDVFEYELPFAYNPGLAVEATAAEGCEVGIIDDSFGYEEIAFYDDDAEIIGLSVENSSESSDYLFTFTPIETTTDVGGDYDGALSVVLGMGGSDTAMPLANSSITITENQNGTMNVSLADFSFLGGLVGDIYVPGLVYNASTGKLTGRRNIRLWYADPDAAMGPFLGHLPVVIDMTLSDTDNKTADASIEIITTESEIDAVSMFEKIHVDFVPFVVDETAELDDDNSLAYKYQTINGPVTKASAKFLQINNEEVAVPMAYIDMRNATIAADVTVADLKQGAPTDNNTIYYLPASSTLSGPNIVVNDATEEFAINDNVGVLIPSGFDADNVTYNRAFTSGNWSTFVLPVAADASFINGKVYEMTGLTSESFEFTEVTGTLEANKPYLVRLSAANMFKDGASAEVATYADGDPLETAITGVSQIGSYVRMEIASDAVNTWYGYSGGQFKKANSGVIKPFRTAFVMPTSSSAPEFDLSVSGATGIKNIEFSADDAPAYDLQGRRVKNASKGVFVIGGKKVILK